MEKASSFNASSLQATALSGSRAGVLSAIKKASASSGVDFSYLVNKAGQESGFNPSAKASGSSATGLYQFIDQTWLKTVKQSGAAYGLEEAASKITVGSDGVARVDNAADRKAILELRKNPEIAAEMAAELAKSNKSQLEAQVGGKIGSTELYLAHFLGAGGASDLLNAMKTNGATKAADLLPQAAAANKSVFYDAAGNAKTVSQVYAQFAKKFDKTPDVQALETQLASADATASATQAQKSVQAFQVASNSTAAYSSLGTDVGGVTLPSGSRLDKTTASPFAAMVLAQMDMETFGSRAIDQVENRFGKSDETRRKSVLDTLSGVG